jgi:hypothetical protein
MNKTVKAMILSAAVSGILSGAALHAQGATGNSSGKQVSSAKAGVAMASMDDKDKHSCKGKNDCKGKGGCKSSDNGCKGKNDCKGKGGCATDGSKPPAA